jgi:hypothetical protein
MARAHAVFNYYSSNRGRIFYGIILRAMRRTVYDCRSWSETVKLHIRTAAVG